MKEVIVKCPECSKIGYLPVEENLLEGNLRGLIAVQVGANLICKHSFIAYIDNNFFVRDTFSSDFIVELPQFNTEQELTIEEIPGKEHIDVYLISLNISLLAFSIFIRGYFNNKKILYISDLEFVKEHAISFLEFIFQDSFDIDIFIEDNNTYKDNKKNYKDYIIFDNSAIIRDKEKIINLKNLKVEKTIIQKFLNEQDPRVSLIIIRNEIQKAFLLAKDLTAKICELIGSENKVQIDTKSFYNFIEDKYKIKLSITYVKFLIEIVENYFKVNVPMMWKYFLLRL